MTKILFYVQHLLGIGHLVRAGRIAKALARDAEVLLVVGGEVPGGLLPSEVALMRLSPVRAGEAGFSSLVHPDGTPFGDADRAARRDRLIDGFEAFAPDVLLIEAFPFGRRPMRFELMPLLERARARRPRPLIACSVRDILQTTRPERQQETVAILREAFDLVLVHGDPALFRLEDSFPAAPEIEDKIRYTGMVGPDLSGDRAPKGEGRFDVVVSVGGGAVGADLLRAAVAARSLTSMADAAWLLLTGPNLRPDLAPSSSPGVTVRAFEPDLPGLLAQARVSVSQAGYNTVADLAAARCRAVLVPFARSGETEQTRRAALLEERGWAATLAEAEVDPAALARAIDRALASPCAGPALRLGGAEGTRAILRDRLSAR